MIITTERKGKMAMLKDTLFTALVILAGNLIITETAHGAPIYSGTCQDVGYNDNGQNIQANCSNGTLSASGCTFINRGMGTLDVICDDSKYTYQCGNGSYNGWFKFNDHNYTHL